MTWNLSRLQREIDEKVWTTDDQLKIHPNVLNDQGDRQIEVLADSSSALTVVCRLCHLQSWRYAVAVVGDAVDAATVRAIIHKARMHCGHFKSISASRHRRALRNNGSTLPSTSDGALRLSPLPRKRPRLHIFDANSNSFVDAKRDRGRAIRQHRVTTRLKDLASSAEATPSAPEKGIVLLAAAATAVSRHIVTPPSLEKPAPIPLSGLEVMELMTVLLEHDYVDKVPVTRAADVRSLRKVRELLLDRIPWLRLVGDEHDETRQSLTMAVLFVSHQLWMPSRMRRFSAHLVDVVSPEKDDDPTRWGSWIRLALIRSDADVVFDDDAALATMHQEIAMENDVFTGRHRTRTTVSAVLQAKWPEQWTNVVRVARHFVRRLDNNNKRICDDDCSELVQHARSLPDVGGYIGAHLVRSLVAVFEFRISPLDAWGAFTMSDDSVGAMLDRIRPLGLYTPRHLSKELCRRLGDSSSPSAAAKRAYFESDLCDAGALALVLCETHSCCGLVERHRQTHPSWRLDKFLHALRQVPSGWSTTLRRAHFEEYDLDFFHPDVVYHPAHKLVQATMVVKGHHDLCRANKPLRVLELKPRFKVFFPETDPPPHEHMPTTPTKPDRHNTRPPASPTHEENSAVLNWKRACG